MHIDMVSYMHTYMHKYILFINTYIGKSSTINLDPFSPERFVMAGKGSRRGKKKGTVEMGEQW
jgi:hypothetical protein